MPTFQNAKMQKCKNAKCTMPKGKTDATMQTCKKYQNSKNAKNAKVPKCNNAKLQKRKKCNNAQM